jgi:hypothetical protein
MAEFKLSASLSGHEDDVSSLLMRKTGFCAAS